MYDESGVDVTPLPLTAVSEAAAAKRAIHDSPNTPSDMLSQPSYQPSTLGTQMGGPAFSRSIFQSSQMMQSEYLDDGFDLGGGTDPGVWTRMLRSGNCHLF